MPFRSDSIPPKSHAEEETVLTPAGRVPADQVVHLRPGQAVRRNEDGTISIVDTPDANQQSHTDTEKEKGEKQ